MKFRTACQDHPAGESVVICLFQGYNRMTRVGFQRGHVNHNHGASASRPRCRHMYTLPPFLFGLLGLAVISQHFSVNKKLIVQTVCFPGCYEIKGRSFTVTVCANNKHETSLIFCLKMKKKFALIIK